MHTFLLIHLVNVLGQIFRSGITESSDTFKKFKIHIVSDTSKIRFIENQIYLLRNDKAESGKIVIVKPEKCRLCSKFLIRCRVQMLGNVTSGLCALISSS